MPNMDKEHFHRAARDGYLDLLKETTRRDCNQPDEDGLTPTLWAAYCGRLDALRLLVGRGGEPDKCDLIGNTALHWSAANGHLHCVTFLVNFGCNLWTLNNDFQSAKEMAALKSHKTILDFLDTCMASRSALSPKSVQKAKEAAVVEAEKRIRRFERLQRKASRLAEKEEKRREKERNKLMQPLNGDGSTVTRLPTNKSSRLTSIASRLPKNVTMADRKHHTRQQVAHQPRFSELVANRSKENRTSNLVSAAIDGVAVGATFGGTAGLQLQNLLSTVRGTLNGNGSSARIAQSLAVVGQRRNVLLKRPRSDLTDSVGKPGATKISSHNPSVRSVPNARAGCTAASNATDSFHSLRSLAGIQRDADVLYVRRVGALQSSGALMSKSSNDLTVKLNRCLYTQSVSDFLLLDSLDSNNNTNASRSSRNSAADSGIESERASRAGVSVNNDAPYRKKNSVSGQPVLPNNSETEINQLKNDKPKESMQQMQSDNSRGLLNRLCPALKGLFSRSAYRKRMTCKTSELILNNHRNRLNRARSEPDLMQASYRLRPDGETDEDSAAALNELGDDEKEKCETTDRLNSLKVVAPKSSMFERPGFGSVAFRRNLFGQVWSANGRFPLTKDTIDSRRLCGPVLQPNSTGNSAANSISSAKSSISTGSSGVQTELTDDLQIKISPKIAFKTRTPLSVVTRTNTSPTLQSNESVNHLTKSISKSQLVEMNTVEESHSTIGVTSIRQLKTTVKSSSQLNPNDIRNDVPSTINIVPQRHSSKHRSALSATSNDDAVFNLKASVKSVEAQSNAIRLCATKKLDSESDGDSCHWQHDVEREVAFERAPTAKSGHVCTIQINLPDNSPTSPISSNEPYSDQQSSSVDCAACSKASCVCPIEDTSL